MRTPWYLAGLAAFAACAHNGDSIPAETVPGKVAEYAAGEPANRGIRGDLRAGLYLGDDALIETGYRAEQLRSPVQASGRKPQGVDDDSLDPGRRAFFRGEDDRAREEFQKDGVVPWEAPFLYLLGGPFRETYPADYWPLMQGRTPSEKYILYSDAGAAYLPEAKESGWKHTEHWEIVADLLDRAGELYADVLGQPSQDGFVGRVYFFTDLKFKKPFEQAIGSPQDNAPGRYSPIHRIVYCAPESGNASDLYGMDFSTLFHEAAHQYLRRMTPNPPPWFDEGIATFFARYRPDLEKRAVIPTPGADKKGWIDGRTLKMVEADDKAAAQGPAAPRYVHDFRTLMTMDFGRFHKFISPRDNQGNQYCQSAAILRYLLDEHSTNNHLQKAGGGRKVFDRFLSGYKENRLWNEVFDQAFEGASMPELEEEFRQFVRNEFR